MCWHRGAAVLYLVMGAVFMGRLLGVDGGVAYIIFMGPYNLHCMSFSIYVSLSYKKFSQKWERIKLISEEDRPTGISLE